MNLLKLLKEHHDLSSEIKWLSVAHDFGRNVIFKYNRGCHYISILFEDPWHLRNLGGPNYDIRETTYHFIYIREGEGTHTLVPYKCPLSLKKINYIGGFDHVEFQYGEECGSLNDIYGTGLKFKYSIPKHQKVVLIDYEKMSSLRSIEARKSNLKTIREKIDPLIFPHLVAFFPKVLIPIIIDYCL